jgi:hypothetical protein
MAARKVLLIVDRQDLRAQYEMVLRFCGYEPVSIDKTADLDDLSGELSAACILTDNRAHDATICSKLLAAAVPVVRIDPFIRHAREHLPFDVVLPLASEPRQLITALRHLLH